jgi:hypothetical protein
LSIPHKIQREKKGKRRRGREEGGPVFKVEEKVKKLKVK